MEGERKRKILIVDDQEAVRDLFARTLERSGLDVVALADAGEGVEAAKQMEPDIIYLSLLFRESNGLKVSKSLHSIEHLKDVPIVVLISYPGELDPKYTRTIGIVDVLVKPLNSADILEMTERLLGEELSLEGGESSSVPAEREEEAGAWAEEADLLFEGDRDEGTPEEPILKAGTAEEETEEAVKATDVTEEEDFPPGPESAGEQDSAAVNISAGEKEGPEDAVPPDVRGEEKEEDIRGGFADEEDRTEEDGDTDEKPPFEMYDEKAKRPAKKYMLFAALALLVAVGVFAALEIFFSPGGSSVRPSSETVKEIPVNKDSGAGVLPQGKKEVKTAENVQPQQKHPPVPRARKTLAASEAPAARNERPAAKPAAGHPRRTETKRQNEGLKGPRSVKAIRKGTYSIQVGAFAKVTNAVSFARKLKSRGLEAFVEKSGASKLHRVLIGRFDDYGKARGQSEILLKKDGIKSVIYHH